MIDYYNEATGYASQHIWCLSQARINWEGCVRNGIRRKNGGDGRVGASISLDEVAVHLDCWCFFLCYLHFAPENPEDGKIYLLVPAHPGYPRQSPESCKMGVCVYVCVTMKEVLSGWHHLCGCRLESIEIGFTVFAVIMGLFAILLFAFSMLAESGTRQNIYSGVSCIMGGRLAALFVNTCWCIKCKLAI